ncbi:MAG: PilN domain-containing protein [Candidatus Pacebacteria bacterium]|nr:PilN domain-containing protein [Candidatus Paceibacterota bacterium]
MINLLPSTIKKELQQLLVYKRIILVAIFLALFLLALAGILFSLQMLLADRNRFFRDSIEVKQKSLESTQLRDFRNLIQEENKQLNKVNQIWSNQVYFYPILEKFFSFVPSDIYLKSISLQKLKTTTNQSGKRLSNTREVPDALVDVEISGFAASRDSLLSFLAKLKAEDSFKEVNIPNTVWLKPANIDFSLNFGFNK